MKDNLSIIITMLMFVILLVIFPLYNYFERQDDMSYNLVLKATTNFTDQVLNSGYMTQEMYNKYVDILSDTGNLYDIQLEAHRKMYVPSGRTVDYYNEQYRIQYNDDIFDSAGVISNTDSLLDKTVTDGAYYLNEGDQFYVKVINSNTTMAGAIFNAIVPTSSKDTIKVNYGGVVKHEAWSKVDETYELLEEEYKLTVNYDSSLGDVTYGGTAITPGTVIKRQYSSALNKNVTISNLVYNSHDAHYVLSGWRDVDTGERYSGDPFTITLNRNITIEPIREYVSDIRITFKKFGVTGATVKYDDDSVVTSSRDNAQFTILIPPGSRDNITLKVDDYYDSSFSGDIMSSSGNKVTVKCDGNKIINWNIKYNDKAISKIILGINPLELETDYVRIYPVSSEYYSYHSFRVSAIKDIYNNDDGSAQYIYLFTELKDGNRVWKINDSSIFCNNVVDNCYLYLEYYFENNSDRITGEFSWWNSMPGRDIFTRDSSDHTRLSCSGSVSVCRIDPPELDQVEFFAFGPAKNCVRNFYIAGRIYKSATMRINGVTKTIPVELE